MNWWESSSALYGAWGIASVFGFSALAAPLCQRE
jgi:hypothetical protein